MNPWEYMKTLRALAPYDCQVLYESMSGDQQELATRAANGDEKATMDLGFAMGEDNRPDGPRKLIWKKL